MTAEIKAERTQRHRAPLLWLVVPYLVGASLRRLGGEWPFPHAAATGAVAAAIGLMAAFGRSRTLHVLWACGMAGAAGLIGMLYPARRPIEGAIKPHRASVIVRVARMGAPHPLDERVVSARFGVRANTWLASGFGTLSSNEEPIYFSLHLAGGAPLPIRGDEIQLQGTLKPVPRRGGPDSFNGYLRGSGIQRELSPAYLVAIRRAASAYARWREGLADRMMDLLAVGFDSDPDLGAIYRAMMLGRKEGLSAAQKQLFVRTGTMHLFAINGLHIGIVALSLHALLALLRTPRPVAAPLVLGALWLDVDSTGASPSAVRAFLMVGAVELASAIGLPMNPLAAITAAGATMLAVAPGAEFGASFQMSFGVVAVLILLGAPLSRRWSQVWDPYPFLPAATQTLWQRGHSAVQRHLAAALGFSAAAALVSAVTGVTYFSVWAPVGLLANLVLMPLATLVIIAGFTAIVAGVAQAGALTALFNDAARLMLHAIVFALRRFSGLPGGCVTAHLRADWLGSAALVLLLASCLRGYEGNWSDERGGWWPPFLVTAGLMIFGVIYG
ncbi:MAG TPA: ComEC/Rec2 family competence protein [Opitutaceae bacterium]|jgi:competence protein ComEC